MQLPLLLYAEGVIPGCTEAIRRQLRPISVRRMTRRLRPYKRLRRSRATAASCARRLRQRIPVTAGYCGDSPAGLLEIATRMHGGGDPSGLHICTVPAPMSSPAGLFEPGSKLIEKTRDDATAHRLDGTPVTSLQRAVEYYRQRGSPCPKKVARSVKLREQLNCFQLYKDLPSGWDKFGELSA